MTNQLFLFQFLLISSFLSITIYEIENSFVYSFKATAPSNSPPPQEFSANKSTDQNLTTNNHTDLIIPNSNLTPAINDKNSSSKLSTNNSLESDDQDVAYRIFDDVQKQLKAQGIDIPLPF